jgi:hypothetical protein
MKKIPTSLRLFPGALVIVVACLFLSGVSGCGPHHGDGDEGGKPSINEDTLRNHVISITEARELTQGFRSVLDTTTYHLNPKFIDSVRFLRSEMFPADVFNDLLMQSDPKQGKAKGIRIYLGKDASGQLRMVLVPVDSLGNDIINHLVNLKPGAVHTRALTSDDGGQGFEEGQQCPTACPNGGSGL